MHRGRLLRSLLVLVALLATAAAHARPRSIGRVRQAIQRNQDPARHATDRVRRKYNQRPAPYTAFKVAPSLARMKGKGRAVKLSYFMADQPDHQSPQSKQKLDAMDLWGERRVRNIVFRDGVDHGDSRLYRLQPQAKRRNGKLRAAESQLHPAVTEVQSNNPKVLAQVLRWTMRENRGKTKYLEVYTHGAGVGGIGMDSNQTDPAGRRLDKPLRIMSLPKLRGALRSGLHGAKLDLVYFRACLMGNVETMYEIKDHVKYAVSSQDVSYSNKNSNITMPKLLNDLAAKGVEPREIARRMSIQGHGKHVKLADGSHSGYTTIGAHDVGRVKELKSSFNTLLKQLNGAMPRHRAGIIKAYDSTPSIYGDMGDLWAFTHQLQLNVKDPGVQRAVDRVRQAQRGMTIHAKDSLGSRANGLSIFMPKRSEAKQTIVSTNYEATQFARDTGWTSFLRDIAR